MDAALTLEGFLAFCESKPADEGYSYIYAFGCAYCQFLNANGFPHARVDQRYWNPNYRDQPDREEDLDPLINRAVSTGKRTFGALASRLRTAIASEGGAA